jgi:hypothetical protein
VIDLLFWEVGWSGWNLRQLSKALLAALRVPQDEFTIVDITQSELQHFTDSKDKIESRS